MKAVRKFGFELEYASQSRQMIRELHAAGLMLTSELHSYHCTCQQCSYLTTFFDEDHECDAHCEDYGCWNYSDHRCGGSRRCPRNNRQRVPGPLNSVPDLRAQSDSTADGEFITRPMDDWDDLQRITEALTTAATNAQATANARCGLHVHVDTSDDMTTNQYNEPILIQPRHQKRRTTAAAYLAFERYFTEIVAPGASIRKRDMNNTLMEAVRSYVSGSWAITSGPMAWMDLGRNEVDSIIQQAINMDRHVDLNWSSRNGTWEFRCFNATNAPWRIELACRMAVAFVEATPQLREAVENVVRGSKFWPVGCDSPWGEIIRPAFSELPAPHPTKRPVVPMDDFINILCDVDDDLRPLIERQANFMRTRYAHEVVAAS